MDLLNSDLEVPKAAQPMAPTPNIVLTSSAHEAAPTNELENMPDLEVIPNEHVVLDSDSSNDVVSKTNENITNLEDTIQVDTVPVSRINKYHPLDVVIGSIVDGVQTRSQSGTINTYLYTCFISQIEPKNVNMALKEASWVEAMQEELMQFSKLKV
jgi:hypothetical protein